MRYLFHPGCALYRTRKQAAERAAEYLKADLHTSCCKKAALAPVDGLIITVCPFCENVHRRNSVETITLWELIPDDFDFPDYSGLELSIHDSCKIRRKNLYSVVRKLLLKMNITIKEPLETMENSPCCEYWGSLENMEKRVLDMPVRSIVVYCNGCFRGMQTGGGKPIHLIDLLFGDNNP
ncbi:MAG: hypothetical protein LBP51_03125 [Deferribacteraceae bacterium]|jgi:hypothetical protein|nr:hypothetical protein [Deferribacteraceae bacterium]